jgi:hypothetical protein
LITKQKSNENVITHTKQNEKKFKAYYQNNIFKAQFSTNQLWKNKIEGKIKLKKKKKKWPESESANQICAYENWIKQWSSNIKKHNVEGQN